MTEQQRQQCKKIIHSAAVASGAGNAVPLPGLGVAADSVALTGMVIALCNVFGGGIGESAAKAMALQALKQQIMKQPLKYAAKELSKFIPFAGQIVGGGLSVALVEAAGWEIANDLDRKYSYQY